MWSGSGVVGGRWVGGGVFIIRVHVVPNDKETGEKSE